MDTTLHRGMDLCSGMRNKMLPSFIIDEIRKRERRREEGIPLELEIPLYPVLPAPEPVPKDERDQDRGVAIIEL